MACNRVFRIDPATLGPASSVPAESPGRPGSITLTRPEPSAILRDTYRDSTTRETSAFTLRRRWFQPVHVFLLFFCIAWDSFLVFWYSNALGAEASWLMIVFPLVHVAVGVGLTYFVIAGFLNRTTLTLTPEALSVRHGPVPWRGNASFLPSDVSTVELGTPSKGPSNGTGASGAHAVSVRLADQSLVRLVGGLTEEEARFIHWTVKDALHL